MMAWHMALPVQNAISSRLQVVPGARKQIMVAGVIVVHVTDDDVGDLRRIDIHGRNPRRHRLHQLPAARRADGSIESGVEHKQDFGTAGSSRHSNRAAWDRRARRRR